MYSINGLTVIMDIIGSSGDNQVRGQLELLKALIQNKANLTFELNQMRIRDSYHQSNAGYRDLKGLITLSKTIKKKLLDLNQSHESLKKTEIQGDSPETINKLVDLISYSQENVGHIESLLNEFEDAKRLIDLLKQRHELLSQEYQKKTLSLAVNERYLNDNTPEVMAYKELASEIKDYEAELEYFGQENDKMFEKKVNRKKNRRSSVQKVKIYQQMSEDTLKLRSKLLIKQDLEKNMKHAEEELKYHFSQVEKTETRLKELEADQALNSNTQPLEQELKYLDAEIQALENELENDYREREELINPVVLGFNMNDKQNKTSSDDSLTVSLAGLIAGFKEMRGEKESLIEQNNRLKQRITNLFNAVV